MNDAATDEAAANGADGADGPRSGMRPKPFAAPIQRLRQLARRAESMGFELVAFELLLSASLLESGRRADLVAGDLAEAAGSAPEIAGQFYRGALRSLAATAAVT